MDTTQYDGSHKETIQDISEDFYDFLYKLENDLIEAKNLILFLITQLTKKEQK